MICLCLPMMLYKSSFMPTSPAPDTCDNISYARLVVHAARSSEIAGNTGARTCQVLTAREVYQLPSSVPDCQRRTIEHGRPPTNTPLVLHIGFHERDINCIIHSFIHSSNMCVYTLFCPERFLAVDERRNLITMHLPNRDDLKTSRNTYFKIVSVSPN